MAYANAAELRSQIQKSSNLSDTDLTTILSAAERNINRFCNRPDGFLASTTAVARYYPGSGTTHQWIDECISVSAVAVKDGSGDDEDDYTAWTVGTVGMTTSADVFPARGGPEYPDFNSLPYDLLIIGPNGDQDIFTSGAFTFRRGFRPSAATTSRGIPTVKVTARWGYAASVPGDIKEATIAFASRLFKRLESSMADALASGELGMLLYRQQLDPDIKQLLIGGRYVKPSTGRR